MAFSITTWLASAGHKGHDVRVVSRAIDAALNLLLPPKCAVCNREGRFLHDSCRADLARLESPYCSLCANPGTSPLCRLCADTPPDYDRIDTPYLMEGAVSEMVYGLKYRNIRALAPELGRLMAAHLDLGATPADVLVPVPLHRSRERERGYNQSELLAREVSRQTGIDFLFRALSRTRDTPPQVSITGHEERKRNLEGAFASTGDLRGLRVLLVDDVVTTGSTMSACASVLKAGGATRVWGLALARQA